MMILILLNKKKKIVSIIYEYIVRNISQNFNEENITKYLSPINQSIIIIIIFLLYQKYYDQENR
jgi:hypothetical protein